MSTASQSNRPTHAHELSEWGSTDSRLGTASFKLPRVTFPVTVKKRGVNVALSLSPQLKEIVTAFMITSLLL